MYLDVDSASSRTDVKAVDDVKSLSVQIDQLDDLEALTRALGSLGQLDGADHVWIDIQALRIASGRAGDASWSSSFDAMIAYAAKHGWVNGSGTSVRAHIEHGAAND
jgi:hypothetical protein